MINETNISVYLNKLSSGELTDQEFDLLFNYLEKGEFQKETYSEKDPILDENFKESLRKTNTVFPANFCIDDENSEDLFLVAAIENQLTESEKIYLSNKCVSDARFEKKHQDFKKTILPVESFIFTEKKSLKKKSLIEIFTPIFWTSAAASLLFIVWFTHKTEAPEATRLSENKNKTYRNIEKRNNPPVKNNTPPFKKALMSFTNKMSAKNDTNPKDSSQINHIIFEDNLPKKDTNIVERTWIETIIQNEITENNLKENNPLKLLMPFKISDKKITENLTLSQYINRRINKWLFRKEKPELQEKYHVLTTILKRTFNIDMKLKEVSGEQEKLILTSLTIGKFKYEHK